jgi:hypothetical protein
MAPHSADAESQASEVERFRRFMGGRGECHTASHRVASEVKGIQVEGGYYKHPDTAMDVCCFWDAEPGFREIELDIPHYWNRLPDGRILDVTHTQLGGEEIVLLSPSDAEYHRYVPLGSMKPEELEAWEASVKRARERAAERARTGRERRGLRIAGTAWY